MDIGAPEILIILAIVLLLFGAKKVPELARSLGQAQKEFKKGAKEGYATADGETTAPTTTAAPAPAPTPAPAPAEPTPDASSN